MNAAVNFFPLEKHWTMAGEENSVCLTVLMTVPYKCGGFSEMEDWHHTPILPTFLLAKV